MFSWIMKFHILFLLTTIWSLSVGTPATRKIKTVSLDFDDIQIYGTSVTSPAAAIQRAADYLWKKIQVDKWNTLSPRIVVALAFAQRAGIPRQWLSVLKKEISIHIKMAIMKRNESPSLFDLAQYINALYAMCQDPRHFHGIDLVSLLRTEANAAKKLDQPFVLLTLCIANEIDRQDFSKLWSMYYRVREDTLGSKALIIMALVCISNAQGHHPDRIKEFTEFKRSIVPLIGSYDVYTKILHVQALNTLRYKTGVNLVKHQDPDGSFGDVLATYYAIPALLNTSLLDLKCKSSNYIEFPLQIGSALRDDKLIIYSLWIQKDTYLDAHSMPISLEGNKTFYDLMKMAEAKNSFFRFLYDLTSEGKKVYSIADIPNDVEMEKVWTLYRGRENSVKFNSKHYLVQQNQGIDRIYPTAGEHFVFWYERSST